MLPRVNNKRVRLTPSATLEALDNDLLIRCTSYLDADGLARLGKTSARFGIPQVGRQRSFVNEIAHRRFRQSSTDEERSCFPKYNNDSGIGLCRALESLRRPLCFGQLVGNGFSPQEHPAKVTCNRDRVVSTSISGYVMRGGRHIVEIEITDDERKMHAVHLGVIRPVTLTEDIDLGTDWQGGVDPLYVSSRHKSAIAEKLRSQRTAKWGDSNIHCCAYDCIGGYCCWADWNTETGICDWRGREGLEARDKISLLLDLEEGTITVFVKGRRLGVMKDRMHGEYCWFVTVYSACSISVERASLAKYVL